MDTQAKGAAGYVPSRAAPAQAGEGQRGEPCAPLLVATPNDKRVRAGKGHPVCPSECFFKGKSGCEQWHTVFQLCESDPVVGCDNYHHLISAYGEVEDAEQLPTGSTDEDMFFRGRGARGEGSYARGSENVPWLVFFTGTQNPKGLSCSSWR